MQINRTINEQEEVENLILEFFESIALNKDPESLKKHQSINEKMYGLLLKKLHSNYLTEKIEIGVGNSKHHDSSLPWLVYWTVHALTILNTDIDGDDFN